LKTEHIRLCGRNAAEASGGRKLNKRQKRCRGGMDMEFLSACYLQQGKNALSLLLQQYRCGRTQMLFTCVCIGRGENAGRAGGYMTEQLLQWFRELPFKKLYKSREKGMERLAEYICEVVGRVDLELENSRITPGGQRVDYAGMICLGERYLMLCRGTGRIYLINTAFGRCHVGCFTGEGQGGGMFLEQGILQQDIGLLFTSEAFCGCITEEMIREGLAVGEVTTGGQMGRHLKELAGEAERRGGADMGAVFLRTCAEAQEENGKANRSLKKNKDINHGGKGREQRNKSGQEEDEGNESRKEERWPVPAGYAEKEKRNREGHMPEREEEEALAERGYICGRLLGQGAFSKVYCVEDKRQGGVYACKVSENAELLEREARIMARLQHPLFTEYYGYWKVAEKGFLLMEYVPGESLEEILERRGALGVKQAVRIGMELAEGLLYLHEGGERFLYRDVKPANVMIRQDGRIKLLDLGCACAMGERILSRAGTPGFAAPEQLRESGSLTAACDVYGWGQTMKALLGTVKRDGGGIRGGREGKKVRKRLRRILEACTKQDYSGRIPDMREVMAQLRPLCEKEGRDGEKVNGMGCFLRGDIECQKNIVAISKKT